MCEQLRRLFSAFVKFSSIYEFQSDPRSESNRHRVSRLLGSLSESDQVALFNAWREATAPLFKEDSASVDVARNSGTPFLTPLFKCDPENDWSLPFEEALTFLIALVLVPRLDQAGQDLPGLFHPAIRHRACTLLGRQGWVRGHGTYACLNQTGTRAVTLLGRLRHGPLAPFIHGHRSFMQHLEQQPLNGMPGAFTFALALENGFLGNLVETLEPLLRDHPQKTICLIDIEARFQPLLQRLKAHIDAKREGHSHTNPIQIIPPESVPGNEPLTLGSALVDALAVPVLAAENLDLAQPYWDDHAAVLLIGRHQPQTAPDNDAGLEQLAAELWDAVFEEQNRTALQTFDQLAGLGLIAQEQPRKWPEQQADAQLSVALYHRREYRFRPAHQDDLPILDSLEQACWPEGSRLDLNGLRHRLETYPEGQWCMTLDGKVIGVIYSLRIQAVSHIQGRTFADIYQAHQDDGTIAQLVAVNLDPAYQDRAYGDALLEFMLQRCSLTPGIRQVVAVTLCKDDYRKHADRLTDYIHMRNQHGRILDPIPRFHELHGAEIIELVPGFRPLDHKNDGNGVLVSYDIHQRRRRELMGGSPPPETEKPTAHSVRYTKSQIQCFLEENLRALLGPETRIADLADEPLMEIGLDSADLMDLSERLSVFCGQKLDPTFFFQYNTVNKIHNYLLENFLMNDDTSISRNVPNAEPNQAKHARTPAPPRDQDIAILAVACRLPGGINDENTFWQALEEGRNLVGPIPEQRRKDTPFENVDPVIQQGGFLPDIAGFDADHFRVSPKEACYMDPQQRILLELSQEALEKAGYGGKQLAGKKVGVYIGSGSYDYRLLLEDGGKVEAQISTGNAPAVLANRISYHHDFTGPSLTIDTACSASLVALDTAVKAVRRGDAEVALVGGVNLICHPGLSQAFQKAGMLAADGRCKTFDQSADGYVRGEGAVLFLIKNANRALADNDPILAIIKGTAANHGGRAAGLTVPNPVQQAELLKQAWTDAGIQPQQLGYFEAHGTGTSLGDPIEIRGLKAAYAEAAQGETAAEITIGSVKTNIGHLEAAAGAAGLLKALLCLKHNRIPAGLHLQQTNSHIDFSGTPFRLATESKPWPENAGPFAGVSSFGFGGANAHTVIAAAPQSVSPGQCRQNAQIFTLSAASEAALRAYAQWVCPFLEDLDDADFTRLIYSSQQRVAMEHRLAVIVENRRQLQQNLEQFLSGTTPEQAVLGNSKQGGEAAEKFRDTQNGAQILNNHLKNGDLREVAVLWAQGIKVDWSAAYQTRPTVLAFPTYPFQRKPYWIPENRGGQPKPAARLQIRQQTPVAAEQNEKPKGIRLADPAEVVGLKPSADQTTADLQTQPESKVLKDKDMLASLKTAVQDMDGLVPTLNRTGFMLEKLISYSRDFAAFAGQAGGEVLDIGCAYGIASIAALEQGAEKVMAVDMETRHLRILENRIRDEVRPRLATQVGLLPDIDFEPGRFSAIHAARVFHFLTPEATVQTLKKMYSWLRPGGRLFLIVDTPFVGFRRKDNETYQKRKAAGDPWPGYIGDDHKNDVHQDASLLTNPMDEDILRRECSRAGFTIQRLGYEGSDIYPEVKGSPMAGMEHVGIIACKPVEAETSAPTEPIGNLYRQQLLQDLAHFLHLDPSDLDPTISLEETGLDKNQIAAWSALIHERHQVKIDADQIAACRDLSALSTLLEKATQPAQTQAAPTVTTVQPESEPRVQTQAGEPIREDAFERDAFLGYLRQSLADELLADVDDLDGDKKFVDMGVDSIIGVQWVTNLNERLDLSIRAGEIYNYPSLNEFSEFLVKAARDQGLIKAEPTPETVVQALPTARAVAPIAQPATERGTAADPTSENDPIAIIGISGQFPGADNPEQFWQNILDGRDCIGPVPENRFPIDQYYDADKNATGKTDCRWMGSLDHIDYFDPLFFNISPREAELMDPQQRLFLQNCRRAVEDAGYPTQTLDGSRCGVFVGCSPNEYERLMGDHHLNAQRLMGGTTSILAARISYLLNLQGPSLAIDTACSSGLVAVAEACNNLRLGNCDLALAGGVTVIVGPSLYVMGTKAGVFSAGGRCFTFDQRADGFVPGEAVGVLLLKRLSDAERDGDPIHAVIRGWGVNQDGKSNGITAPNAHSQARLQKEVYRRFQIDPSRIEMLEAHGTGTKLGDPIEVDALRDSFESMTDKRNYCALGSVKSNVGHTLMAAGVTGIIKCLKAFAEETLPRTIQFEQLNEHIRLDQGPFFINLENRPWPVREDRPRLAAVSSFGFSGTNAHVVLESYDRPRPTTATAGSQLFLLSAKNETRLKAYATELADYLATHQEVPLADVAHTFRVGREAMTWRLASVCGDRQQLVQRLRDFVAGKESAGIRLAQVRKESNDLIAEPEGAAFLESLWKAGKLEKVAELWLSGNRIDWQRLPCTAQRRNGLPSYPFAQESYWVPDPIPFGLQNSGQTAPSQTMTACLGSSQSETSGEETWDGVSYLPCWQALAQGEKEEEPPAAETVLIVHGPGAQPQVASLRRYLENTMPGRSPIQIQIGSDQVVGGTTHFVAVDDSRGFENALAGHAKVDRLYFLAFGLAVETEPARTAWEAETQVIQLLRLLKCLREKGSGFIHTYLISGNAWSQDQTAVAAEPAGITGLGFALAQGEHRFLVRNLDLSSHDLAQLAQQPQAWHTLTRQAPDDRGALIRLDRGARYRRIFRRLRWLEQGSGFRQGGTYVLLGGSGTIGGIVSRYLQETYQAQVIWIGRRPQSHADIQTAIQACRTANRVPAYYQADATDAESLKSAVTAIRTDHPVIHGAMFAGIVFDFENSIAKTSEKDFRAILDIKTRGTVNFYNAFADINLDFMAYFSSGQAFSFSGAATLSAYAAGITFSDAFIQSRAAQAPFPLGRINWGFWQASLPLTPVGQTVHALEGGLGATRLDHFVAGLRAGRLPQLLCMNASEPVKAIMNVDETGYIDYLPSAGSDNFHGHIRSEEKQAAETIIRSWQQTRLDRWTAHALLSRFVTMGLFQNPGHADAETLARTAGISPKFLPWWRSSLHFLAQHHDLHLEGEREGALQVRWSFAKTMEQARREFEQRGVERDHIAQDPCMRAKTVLLDACLEALPEILREQTLATEIIFAGGRMTSAEAVYKNNPVSDYFNDVLAARAAEYIQHRLREKPEQPLRILEIGAGTGGTTARVLPALEPYRDHIQTYVYSDLSKAFLDHAERTYKPGAPYLEGRIINIEKPLQNQGLQLGSFDLVIATNVLHATSDMRRTVAHAKSALRTNGLFLINEMSCNHLFAHLTFGLLDGWWLSADPELRVPGSPVLTPETWERLLREQGFHHIQRPVQCALALQQQVIMGRSDGLIQREQTTRAPKPAAAIQTQVRTESVTAAGGGGEKVLAKRVEHAVLSALSDALKLDIAQIDRELPFSDYGVDSILGVGFVQDIARALELKINTAVIFDYATVKRLSRYIVDTFGDDLRAREPQQVQTPVGIPVAVPQEPQTIATAPMSTTAQTPKDEAIAVIGISGQFPEAENVDSFWQNLISGKNGIRPLQPPYTSAGQSGRFGGILKNRACFDPMFFNITPLEAESMNPHQRLILQESWRSLEDAGYNPKSLDGRQVGIYIGAEPSAYVHRSFTGASDAIVASRLSYYLNLRGPAMVVNTGCSSSGTALHLACESLRRGDCDTALAGGVFAVMNEDDLNTLHEAGMVSPQGRSLSFDAAADGTVFSEAVAMVVLKPLAAAEADGDPIYGVIEASALNQDGEGNGITAPNGAAQETLITDLYRRKNIPVETIGYVEAHGTGTRLGDPVEANALTRALRRFPIHGHRCFLGSAKAHIGHTAAAAGAVGLIKILLSLKHGLIPAMPHFNELNPHIELEGGPLTINRETQVWRRPEGGLRRAVLNSFGHSGTNVHLVVREYPGQVTRHENPSLGSVLVPISVKTVDCLKEAASNLLAYLDREQPNLADLAFTLQLGREPMPVRLAFVVSQLSELRAGLEAFIAGKNHGGYFGNGEGKTLDTDDEEEAAMLVRHRLQSGRLDKVAEFWAAGGEVDWSLLPRFGNERRIHLPTYPFAKEHYWKPLGPTPVSIADPVFTVSADDALIGQHQVAGRPTVPGVLYLSWLAQVGKAAGFGDRLCLRDLVWMQPLSPQGTQRISVARDAVAPNRVRLGDGRGNQTYVQAELEPLVGDASRTFDLGQLQAEYHHELSNVAALYQTLQADGIEHGPRFRNLRRVRQGDRGLLLEVGLEDPAELQTLDAGLLDAGLQALRFLREDGEAGAHLPFAVDRVELHGALEATMWVLVEPRLSGAVAKYDVFWLAGDGRIRVAMFGFSTRPRVGGDGDRLQTLIPCFEPVEGQAATLPAVTHLSCAELVEAKTLTESAALDADKVTFLCGQAWSQPGREDFSALDNAAGFHLLWQAPATGNDDLTAAAERNVTALFDRVRSLLAAGLDQENIHLTVLTRAAVAVSAEDTVDPAQAVLHGFVGSLAKEYPHWRVRLIDLAEDEPLDAERLACLPALTGGDAWFPRHGQLFRRFLAPLETSAEVGVGLYKKNGVYLVVGGAGGVGSVWSRYLAERFQAQLIWVGRRELNAQIRERQALVAAVGPEPLYLQADAGDPVAMVQVREQVLNRFGRLDGIVHSAIVLEDRPLADMDRAQLKRALNAKLAATVVPAQTFADQNLDFHLFFSSIIAFSTTPGQSNYAAGTAFCDAFAQQLGQKDKTQVRVVNWGYWGSTGIVDNEQVRQRMRRLGFASLEAEEAMAALDAVLDGPSRQVALLKVCKPAPLWGTDLNTRVQRAEKRVPALAETLAAQKTPMPEAPDVSGWWTQDVETCLGAYLYAHLAELGCFEQAPISALEVAARFAVEPGFEPWFLESFAALTRLGFLRELEDRLVPAVAADLEASRRQWTTRKTQWETQPQLRALVRLAEATMAALPGILRGQVSATEIIFPNASTHLVEGVYKWNPISDYYNQALTAQVVAYLKSRIAQSADVRLRILEVGAGTGGTSAVVLPALKAFSAHIDEYRYTDISQTFLQHAQTHFAGDHPFLTTAIFNAEQDAEGQGFKNFDLVIATNCLHATRNMRNTMNNVKATLAENGLLVLNEMSRNSLIGHLTFGLLKGWWLYDDPAIRISGSPALAPQQWRRLLAEMGFRHIHLPLAGRADLGQEIILAESNGLHTRSKETPSRTLTPTLAPLPEVKPLASTKGSLREQTIVFLKEIVAETFRIPGARIRAGEPLERYGIDSILVVQLTNALSRHFRNPGSTLLFEYQTIEALADYFVEHRGDELRRIFTQAPEAETVVSEKTVPVASEPKPAAVLIKPVKFEAKPVLTKNTDSHARRAFDVAVIGMAGRYPGAQDLDAFWQNLVMDRDVIREIPSQRWDWRAEFDPEKGKPGKSYSKFGGFLDDIDAFDPLFFRISPRDAERMDPQERLFLQTAYHAVQDAGYRPGDLCPQAKVGVFVGAMNGTYARPSSFASIANRVSYSLDFKGPSLAVDTACSSSLTAIVLALESLYSGSSNVALAGGVNLIIDPVQYRNLSEMTVLSQGRRCASFAAEADGIVDAEGVGALLLKPLDKALADGDPIHGIIKGGSINAGGKTNGYTVPNPVAQADLVRDALERSGVRPEQIHFIEAHGTGTILGDPIEVAGLAKAFQGLKPGTIGLGSAKAHMGHAESAAGIAGVTKVLLQMKHRRLAPATHIRELNPEIRLEQTPFRINRQVESLPDGTLYAGISSFGAGGSNAHLVLASQPQPLPRPKPTTDNNATHLCLISAKNEAGNRAYVQSLLDYLTGGSSASASASGSLSFHPLRRLFAEHLSLDENEVEAGRSFHEYALDPIGKAGFVAAAKARFDCNVNEEAWMAADCLQDICDLYSDLQPAPDLPDFEAFIETLQIGREALDYRLAFETDGYPTTIAVLSAISAGRYPEHAVYGDVDHDHEDAHLDQSRVVELLSNYRRSEARRLLARHWQKGADIDWRLRLPIQQPVRRIRLPLYPFAQERFWKPFFGQSQGGAQPQVATAEQRQSLFLEPAWTVAPTAAGRAVSKPLILTGKVGNPLARALAAHFNQAQILDQDADLPEPQNGHWDAVVDLSGLDPENPFEENRLARLQVLVERKLKDGALFLGVARGLHRHYNPSVHLDGALPAALYTMLAAEYRGLSSRAVDLDPAESHETQALRLRDELLAGDGQAQVCYRLGNRYGRQYQTLDLASDQDLDLASDAVILITGGTSGLGALCAHHLVKEHGARKLVLCGRSQVPDSDNPESIDDPQTREKMRALQELRKLGARVFTAAPALEDGNAVAQLRRQIEDQLGPVTHIIHCAGTGDRQNPAFIRKTPHAVAATLAPKVDGLKNLHRNFAGPELRSFVLFSSLCAGVPSQAAGLSDYAMANAFMDAFSEKHRDHTPIVAVQWPNWSESGIGEVTGDTYRAAGFYPLSDREGLHFLDRILASGRRGVILPAIVDPNRFRLDALSVQKAEQPTKPLKPASSPGAASPNTQSFLVGLFCEELKLSAERFKTRVSFADYGADSILLAQVLKRIAAHFGEELDPSLLFEYDTVEKLAAYLENTFDTKTLPGGDEPEPAMIKVAEQNGARTIWGKPLPAGNQELAIVGMACRFPGADNLTEYADLIFQGRNAVTTVPDERWPNPEGFRAGLINGIYQFDAEHFLIAATDAAAMDPQALVLLEETRNALYHAGYQAESLKGRDIGVYVGGRCRHQPEAQTLAAAVNPIITVGQNYLAANLSQFFDFRGPSLVVDTACSSALTALHAAGSALQRGDIEAAVVAGVSLLDQPVAHQLFHQRGLLNPEGNFHIFDQRAKGVVLGEGVGVVYLKTLEKAQDDGDRIYAVIKAVGINNDGRTAGPASPNLEAQRHLLHKTLKTSGLAAADVAYIEVNGSGSTITDLLELKALGAVYGKAQKSALGSMKPNIGHPLCAEGIAALIKTALVVAQRRIPPFLSGQLPLKHFNFEQSPFYLPSQEEAWPAAARAAVLNSFADGGTNAHLVLVAGDNQHAQQQPITPPELHKKDVRRRGPQTTRSGSSRPGNFWNQSRIVQNDDPSQTS